MDYFSDHYSSLIYKKSVPGQQNSGLRNAQLGAMHAIASHFTNSSLPAIVVMPTGSGKSAVLSAVPYILSANRALVITPSRLVREQIAGEIEELRTLKKLGALPTELEPPKLQEVSSRIGSADEWEALRQFNIVVAAPPSVSPDYDGIPMPPADLFDLLLIDEAHHAPAGTWQAVLNAFKTANRVMFTATPFRRDKREIKGKLVYIYHIRSAFEDEIFGKVRFSPATVTAAESDDIVIARETQRVFDVDKAAGLQHRVMVRTDQKTRAKVLEDVYRDHTSLRLQSINSGHTLKHIQKTIQHLRDGNLDGVICVDMMGEGFDFPNLKIAAIHSPHRSLAVTLQFIGRFARTNAENIGEATFISVSQNIGSDLDQLYREGAVWQDIITDMHGDKLVAEAENREIIDSFDEPTVDDLTTDDVPLSAIEPSHHVKVFKVAQDIDIHTTVKLPKPLESVYQRVSTEHDAVVVIGYAEENAVWTKLELFQQKQFELFVIYYDENSRLLFIHSTVRGKSLYENVAKNFTGGNHRNVSTERLNRILRDMQGHHFFNVGMKNRLPMPDQVSYSISAGPNPAHAIDKSTGRLNHRGHVMGSGIEDGQQVTIGYSSGSKIWSNAVTGIPEFIKWCKKLAERMISEQPLPEMPGLDNLPCGKEITKLPDYGVIAVDWHADVYKNHMLVACQDAAGAEVSSQITDLAFSIDRDHTDLTGIRFNVIGPGWTYPIHYTLDGMPQVAIVDATISMPVLKRGFTNTPLIDFIKDKPLNFYLSDFSRVAGIELFDAGYELQPFDPALITAVDWAAANVNIEDELGAQSIQEYLCTSLLGIEHDAVLHDHGSGEMADFVTVSLLDDKIVIKLYHVKGAGGASASNRVNDAYEVCGQVVKSLIWLRKADELLAKIRSRRKSGSSWLKGDDVLLNSLFKQGLEEKGFQFEIVLVQPGITKDGLLPKVGEMLAAAKSHVAACAGASLQIMASA